MMSQQSEEDQETLRSLSLDYLNLLINGQAFSDVAFSVDGRLVHAHRCILAARSLYFRKFFCSTVAAASESPPPSGLPFFDCGVGGGNNNNSAAAAVVPVSSVSYEVFLLVLQFLYSGHVSVTPQKHEPRHNCPDRGCWHTHCSAAVQLALDTLAASRAFGVDQLSFLVQKQLAGMVEKASIEDVMKVLLVAATRKQQEADHQLWTTCSNLVAKSGLPPEVLAKHLPIDLVTRIEQLRQLKSSIARSSSSSSSSSFHLIVPDAVVSASNHPAAGVVAEQQYQKVRRMRRALDSSDVELVKLMVMGEGLNLDESLALHYAVERCSREVVKALLELGAADVNLAAGPAGKTPLHLAAEMVCPDMVAVLLDHHADPNIRTTDGVTALDILRGLTSDFLFKGAIPGIAHVEPNKLRLCLELVQSAAMVILREEAAAAAAAAAGGDMNSGGGGGVVYRAPIGVQHDNHGGCGGGVGSLSLDSRMVYLNLGMAAAAQLGCKMNDGGGGGGGGEEGDSSSSRSGVGGGGGGGGGMYSPHEFN